MFDLDEFMEFYNNEWTHQGNYYQGRTSLSLKTWQESRIHVRAILPSLIH
ncbi:MAG: hypothetical protein ACE5EK_06310 [Nitrospinales bacterium]